MSSDPNEMAQSGTPISRANLMIALRVMTEDPERFDHRRWALWNADVLERLAKMIREGYGS